MTPSRAPRAPAVRAELVPAGDTAVAAAPPPAISPTPVRALRELDRVPAAPVRFPAEPRPYPSAPPAPTARISGRDTRREI